MQDVALEPETDVRVQEILLAASQHDLPKLQDLLKLYSFEDCEPADVQDPETGVTPLHAAIATCEPDAESEAELAENSVNNADVDADYVLNGVSAESVPNGASTQQDDLVATALETVKCLLEYGAIWNQLDVNNETPGCIANRLMLKDIYNLMVDAGFRAELLLSRLEGYEELADSDESKKEERSIASSCASEHPVQNSAQHKDPLTDATDLTSTQYLSSTLSLDATKILDQQSNGVMMSWESGIMESSAQALLTAPGKRFLNIGFGMGIIDNHVQSHINKPTAHHIVEAHHTVLADIETKGWYARNDVVVHPGKWQDVLPRLVIEGHTFDAIFFDTFAESYSDFRNFFSEQVIGLLDPGGTFSFFNGMGADRQISYDVYQKVVEMDLFEAGFDVDWQEVDVPTLDGEWEGIKRRYWNIGRYRLPTCKFME